MSQRTQVRVVEGASESVYQVVDSVDGIYDGERITIDFIRDVHAQLKILQEGAKFEFMRIAVKDIAVKLSREYNVRLNRQFDSERGELLAKQIATNRYCTMIVVLKRKDKYGKTYYVVAGGNHRLYALLAMGCKDVLCYCVDDSKAAPFTFRTVVENGKKKQDVADDVMTGETVVSANLRTTLNIGTGEEMTVVQRRLVARTYCLSNGITEDDKEGLERVASKFCLSVENLKAYVGDQRILDILGAHRVCDKLGRLKHTHLQELKLISGHKPIAAMARLAIDAEMSCEDLRIASKVVRQCTESDEARLKIIAKLRRDYKKQIAEKAKKAEAKKTGKPDVPHRRLSNFDSLCNRLDGVLNLLASSNTTSAYGFGNDNDEMNAKLLTKFAQLDEYKKKITWNPSNKKG